MNYSIDDTIFVSVLLSIVLIATLIMIVDWALTGSILGFILAQINLCLSLKIIFDWKFLTFKE